MKQYKEYRVVCESCGGSDLIKITPQNQVFYTEHTPIISARYRPDMHWGFECLCGQDSRVAPEEKDILPKIVRNASEGMLQQIAKTLTPMNELKFRMVAI